VKNPTAAERQKDKRPGCPGVLFLVGSLNVLGLRRPKSTLKGHSTRLKPAIQPGG
jgi:hypothetical protein